MLTNKLHSGSTIVRSKDARRLQMAWQCQAGRSRKRMKLSREDFAILQETWDTNFPIFDQILTGYRQYAKALAKKSKHCPIPSLKLWTIPRPMRARWTKKEFEEALLMKTMTRNCLVPLTHTNFINTRTHAHKL